MSVTFYCEADVKNVDYFIIEFSDHSVYFKYHTQAKKHFTLLVVKVTIILKGKFFSHKFVFVANKKYTLNGINTLQVKFRKCGLL